MPKQKTRSSAKKRFSVTGAGKILRRHTHKSHNLEHKSAKRRRSFRHAELVSKADEKKVFRMLGKR
jgi:large subunit ribosomal protein L35